MSTQLTLIDLPEPQPRQTRRMHATTAAESRATTVNWRIDDSTRELGRRGIAAARAALQAARVREVHVTGPGRAQLGDAHPTADAA